MVGADDRGRGPRWQRHGSRHEQWETCGGCGDRALVAGKALATRLAAALTSHGALRGAVVEGRRLSILRETRMPAVLCGIGDVREAVDRAPALAAAISDAVNAWIALRTVIN